MIKPIIPSEQAVEFVTDGCTLAFDSFLGYGLAESLITALEKRFVTTGTPRDITVFFCTSQGVADGYGLDQLAHKGLIRRAIGGHWNLQPKLSQMAYEDQFEAYNLPQGVLSRLTREMAAHGVGIITHTGLHTFADPRVEGGRINSTAKEDMVKLVNIDGKELLHYLPIPLDIAFLRGTYADSQGNISFEKEALSIEACSVAQAVKNNGGKVFVQVEKIVATGSLNPWTVKIPGLLVDAIVLADNPSHQSQCHGAQYDGSLCGEYRVDLQGTIAPMLNEKKIIGRRAILDICAGNIINLGIGVPEYVSKVACEEEIFDDIILTVESGVSGGLPCSGIRFGASVNVGSIVDQCVQFDFYSGGGIDHAFLGMAQVDAVGNVNVSKIKGRIIGSGGFVDISQNAKRVSFCGTFSAGGLTTSVEDGRLIILKEGIYPKFVEQVEQITFSGYQAQLCRKPVLYITERAVFELSDQGLTLIEIAPGVDLQTQVIDLMGFLPRISPHLKLMDMRIFVEGKMNLAIKHA